MEMERELYVGDSFVLSYRSLNLSITNLNNQAEFKCVRGWEGEYDDDGTLLVSDFDISVGMPAYLAILVTDRHQATGDYDSPQWEAALKAVSPSSVSAEKTLAALSSSGILYEDLEGETGETRRLITIQSLIDAGISAPLADFQSDDAAAAVSAARLEAQLAKSVLWTYLDRPVNAAGSNGWDFMTGKV